MMVIDPPLMRRPPLHHAAVDQSMIRNGTGLKNTPSLRRMQDRTERANLVLWWRPLVTLYYFSMECSTLFVIYMRKLYRNWQWLLLLLIASVLAIGVYNLDGTHQEAISALERQVLWCAYWVGLGILSSVGLGTGLHTFVLYLGPHIAQVTIAAYECGSVNFPEPPYPNSIVCPTEQVDADSIGLLTIISKVRLEALMWGAGTAIGELPPYFMARAARLSGEEDLDDDEREELAELSAIEQKEQHPEELGQLYRDTNLPNTCVVEIETGRSMRTKFESVWTKFEPLRIRFNMFREYHKSYLERMKVYVHALVHKAGFVGILACASIPNPLFDLAGITCGHFLIPFWRFFGATLLGKAVIKMHIQMLFVIFAFSQHHADTLVNLIRGIPLIGSSLQRPFEDLLTAQRAKLHKPGTDSGTPGQTPWLSWLFEKVVTAMIVYFVISIVNSFAQNYHKRLCKKVYEREAEEEANARSSTSVHSAASSGNSSSASCNSSSSGSNRGAGVVNNRRGVPSGSALSVVASKESEYKQS